MFFALFAFFSFRLFAFCSRWAVRKLGDRFQKLLTVPERDAQVL
jgi:hypothetical protein